MKKLLSLLLISIMIFNIIACGIEKETVQDRMVNYINEKYNDTFSFKSVFGGSMGSTTKKIIVSSEAFPNKDVYVICTYDNGIETFTDNYLGIKYENETRDALSDSLNKAFGNNFYVKYVPNNLACTDGGNSFTTFEEYISTDSSHISFEATVVCDELTNKSKIEENIKESFSNMAVIGRIYFIDDKIEFTANKAEDLFTFYIENKKYTQKLYFIKDKDDFTSIKWEE